MRVSGVARMSMDCPGRYPVLGIGSTELVIILVFGFLLFGPDKLPQMGRTIGRALRQFRETQEKLTAVVQTEVVDPMAAAAKKPVVAMSAAAADDDDDVDAPVAQDAAPARKETFAERRARLAAERAEAEAAKAAADAAEGAAEKASDASEAPAPDANATAAGEQAASADEPAVKAEAPAEEPAELTTEDLYARRPRKRKAASESAPVEEAAASDSADQAKGGEQ